MRGPQHYRAAENLLEEATTWLEDATPAERDEAELVSSRLIAEAHVHATLALAAATALNDAKDGMRAQERSDWPAVAGRPLGVQP